MPKKKTNKSAAKRFWRTATGKLKYKHAGASHLLSSKSSKRKRHLHKVGIVSAADKKRIGALIV